ARRIGSGGLIVRVTEVTTSTAAQPGRTVMTDADLWAAWRVWMLVASLIVLVAAALLVSSGRPAGSLAAHARRAVVALEAIRENTRAIWALQTTNEVAEELRD